MSNTSMQGGATSDAMTTQLTVRDAKLHDLSFVITNQGKTNRLIARIEGATGPADTPEAPDFSRVSVVMPDKLIDPTTAELKDLPAATFNNYRVLVKSAVAGAKTNFRAYCEKSDVATGSPLAAGAFDRYFKTTPPPAANYEARGRGLVIKGTNLDLVTKVVLYDARNPTASLTGVRVVADVAPYADNNILNDGLGAYVNNAEATELMVVWPLGYEGPVNKVALVDAGSTPDAPREVVAPTGGVDIPTPVITSVTAPSPLNILVEGENLGGATYVLTERGGEPRNYDKGGWFGLGLPGYGGHFGAPLPTETAILIAGDYGADDLDPVDTAGIRDRYGNDTVATGLAVDMDDPGTSAAPTISNAVRSGSTITVTGTNLDNAAVERLTAGFTNGSITAYKPGGQLEPYNPGNGITVLTWDATTIQFQSPYLPSGTLLGVSAQNLSGSSLADYPS